MRTTVGAFLCVLGAGSILSHDKMFNDRAPLMEPWALMVAFIVFLVGVILFLSGLEKSQKRLDRKRKITAEKIRRLERQIEKFREM